jgi:hypothetical protein
MQGPSSSLHMSLMAKGMESNVSDDECWRWISVNLEYLLYIGFDYDLQLTRH